MGWSRHTKGLLEVVSEGLASVNTGRPEDDPLLHDLKFIFLDLAEPDLILYTDGSKDVAGAGSRWALEHGDRALVWEGITSSP